MRASPIAPLWPWSHLPCYVALRGCTRVGTLVAALLVYVGHPRRPICSSQIKSVRCGAVVGLRLWPTIRVCRRSPACPPFGPAGSARHGQWLLYVGWMVSCLWQLRFLLLLRRFGEPWVGRSRVFPVGAATVGFSSRCPNALGVLPLPCVRMCRGLPCARP